MKIKRFKCGLCKIDKSIWMTRYGLRRHLREEHRIMTAITNQVGVSKKKDKQSWWIEE